MALNHAKPGEIIDVSPFGDDLSKQTTQTLAQSEAAEIIRLVLPAGKNIATHSAAGQIIVQCIEGQVSFTTMGNDRILTTGDLLYLSPGEPHSVKSLDDSSLLLTILFSR